MTIDFTCKKCEASFELDADDLADGTEKLQCPNCDAKASQTMVDDFVSAFTELKSQVALMAKKFAVNLAVETEDLEEELEEDDAAEEEEDADEDDDLDLDDDDDDVDDEDEDLDEDADR